MTRAAALVVEKVLAEALAESLEAWENEGPAANRLNAIEEAIINSSQYRQAASEVESKGARRLDLGGTWVGFGGGRECLVHLANGRICDDFWAHALRGSGRDGFLRLLG